MSFLEFDKARDFPYYNHNPRLSKLQWIILLIMVPVSFLLYIFFSLFSEFIASIIFCFSLLIPLLYFSNWDYSLIFHKPTINEIILGVLMFFGYMIYSIAVGSVLDFYNLSGVDNAMDIINIESTISLIFSMMGEELVKFIPFMFFMRVVFKFSNNRKLSIAISSIIVLIGFGLLHYDPPYSTIVSVLLLQGVGSIFEIYAYFKTKNLFISYLSHILTDAFVFIGVLLGFV